MTWGEDYNGGPVHVGKCPECGGDTYTCYNELCESCYELSQVPEDLEDVTDEAAEEFTEKTLIITEIMEEMK
jgi:hypothetical protein